MIFYNPKKIIWKKKNSSHKDKNPNDLSKLR